MAIPTQTSRTRPTIDPKTLLKHSTIVRSSLTKLFTSGVKHTTPTGFTIPGYSNSNFETFYEFLQPGAATAQIVHKKKTRVIRFLSGICVVLVTTEDEFGNKSSVEKRIKSGDELTVLPGIAYKIATLIPDTPVEMLVIQDAKYESRCEVIEDCVVSGSFSLAFLEEQDTQVNTSKIPIVQSKAVQQQVDIHNKLRPLDQIPTSVPFAPEVGINASPSFGRFDEVGAG